MNNPDMVHGGLVIMKAEMVIDFAPDGFVMADGLWLGPLRGGNDAGHPSGYDMIALVLPFAAPHASTSS